MGPESDGEFKVTLGRVFMVPLDEKGEIAMGPARELTAGDFDFNWGDDWGSDQGSEEGLDGGLHGWPDGARIEAHGGDTWNIQLELSGEVSEEVVALLMGFSVEEWRDLKQWAAESAWLERVTGLNWGRFE